MYIDVKTGTVRFPCPRTQHNGTWPRLQPMSAALSRASNTMIKPVPCLPYKIYTSENERKYSNNKTTILNRFTLSILLPTSIFMMSFFVEYISTSFSHSSSFSNVSLQLVSYTKGKRNSEECYICTVLEPSIRYLWCHRHCFPWMGC